METTGAIAWRPWSEETCAYSMTNNRPVMLVIGHERSVWCKLMERGLEDIASARASLREEDAASSGG